MKVSTKQLTQKIIIGCIGLVMILGILSDVGLNLQAKTDTDVLFLFDTSGSMILDAGGSSRMDVAKVEFRDTYIPIVQAVAGNTGEFAAMIFGEGQCEDPRIGRNWGSSIADVSGLLNSLEPDGDTPLAEALILARTELKSRVNAGRLNPSMLIISDGLETCGGDAVAAAMALRQEEINDPDFVLSQKFILFFTPFLGLNVNMNSPDDQSQRSIKAQVDIEKLEDIGNALAADGIFLVNSAATFSQALQSVALETHDPAPNVLGRLYSSLSLNDQADLFIYLSDDTNGDSDGNDDGVIDPGEEIEFGFRIFNNSVTTIQNISLRANVRSDTNSIISPGSFFEIGDLTENESFFSSPNGQDLNVFVLDRAQIGDRFFMEVEIFTDAMLIGSAEFLVEVGSRITVVQDTN